MAHGKASLFSWFGPGLLFAGAAVGVSHLVQSTRAGAIYGFGMIAVVVLANVLKFPAFRFGSHYAGATGESLLDGYRRQGAFTLVIFALLTIGTMFTILAVVTLVTAGVASAVLGIDADPLPVSMVVLLLCGLVTEVGGYRWLDRAMKLVMPTLAILTIVAAASAAWRADLAAISWSPWSDPEAGPSTGDFEFMAALAGWMPSAIDIAVWSSLWAIARAHDRGVGRNLRATLLDFNVGYVGTAVLAVAFVVLGATVMHANGIAPAGDSAVAFSAQVIDLYGASLGDWARPVIGWCALLTMFSTTLTVADGFPRVLSSLWHQFELVRRKGLELDEEPDGARIVHRASFVLLSVVALVLIGLFRFAFGWLVDLAQTLSFLTAPALAWFNHRAVTAAHVPAELRPGRGMRAWSWIGIGATALLALGYVVLQVLDRVAAGP